MSVEEVGDFATVAFHNSIGKELFFIGNDSSERLGKIAVEYNTLNMLAKSLKMGPLEELVLFSKDSHTVSQEHSESTITASAKRLDDALLAMDIAISSLPK